MTYNIPVTRTTHPKPRPDDVSKLGFAKYFTDHMIPEAKFSGGGEMSLQNIFFNPNIPSEECFITPMRGQAEGIVYSTKPLSYQGQLIDRFWIRFREGKAVEWHAEENESLLSKIISMYENEDLTPEERNETWLRLERKYRPWIDFDNLPFYGRGSGWQRQLHIYLYPLYYIDYCMPYLFIRYCRMPASKSPERVPMYGL